MKRKRGPIMSFVGIGLVISSMLIVAAIMPEIEPELQSGTFFPKPENIFEEVTDEVQIYEGGQYSFSYSATKSDVPLMWGIQISEFERGDAVSLSIRNIFNDRIESVTVREPMYFDSFNIPESDVYNFEVQNQGDKPVYVKMMFQQNPEGSSPGSLLESNPDSAFSKHLMPLAVSGALLIAGVIVLVFGIILSIVDWKNERDQSRYI